MHNKLGDADIKALIDNKLNGRPEIFFIEKTPAHILRNYRILALFPDVNFIFYYAIPAP